MFSLYSILEFTLLILNGFCIINKERVLNKYLRNNQHSFHSDDQSIIMRLVNLILSIQTVLRVPLIPINIVVIVFKLLLG
uniref:Immediate early response 3-interacting protein 1 n=1 Tax=Panagrolaimus sp. PS1159 TaxID=55785 RepID=A0AC35F5W1_9BILA